MADYGVVDEGFRIKPISVILAEKQERARAVFGSDVDLRSTSTLRKLLDLSSYEDQELWKTAERMFGSTFVSTASGSALDLLGEDVGVQRRFLKARGEVKLTLASAELGRVYQLPVRTLLETSLAPVRRFHTLERASLSDSQSEAIVPVEARERGPQGNVAAGEIDVLNPLFASRFLSLGAATVTVTNDAALQHGDEAEDDLDYRAHLLRRPRTLWTLEAVRRAIRALDSVRDCRVSDPAGGVDVSLSKFNLFGFRQRRFGSQRLFGSPYRFDVLIATHPGLPWETLGGALGVRDEVVEAIREVRPISIFPNVRRADHVQVGIRCRLHVASGHDGEALRSAAREVLAHRINALGLGRSVLYSEIMTDLKGITGVLDVTQLRLRRCPPLLNRVNFGRRGRFRAEAVELPTGENVVLEPHEIAEFRIDSELIQLEATDR